MALYSTLGIVPQKLPMQQFWG